MTVQSSVEVAKDSEHLMVRKTILFFVYCELNQISTIFTVPTQFSPFMAYLRTDALFA